MDIVTLIPRFPLSANSWAMEVSNTRQSEFMIAELTPSWIDLGVASHVKRLLWPFSSNLQWRKLWKSTTATKLRKSPVCKIFRLFPRAYKLYYSEELLVTVELLLLLQHQHEVVPKTGLHHHPVHSTWKYTTLRISNILFRHTPGRLISVARNTMSSPCSVVIDLCTWGK